MFFVPAITIARPDLEAAGVNRDCSGTNRFSWSGFCCCFDFPSRVRKNQAEVDKLRAETEKLKVEAERARAEIDGLHLGQMREGRSQNDQEMERVLLQAKQFLEAVSNSPKESATSRMVSSRTSMTVGSSAWVDDHVQSFHEGQLSSEQAAFARVMAGGLGTDEARILSQIGAIEAQERGSLRILSGRRGRPIRSPQVHWRLRD